MANRRFKKVRTERQATDVICVQIYGWRGEKRLTPRVIRGFYACNEEASWDISCGGSLLNMLADRIFNAFKEKCPEGQSWSVSECWSRKAK
jgi:hypothetical protein